jgi:mono/diheme cytochrome c family protein
MAAYSRPLSVIVAIAISAGAARLSSAETKPVGYRRDVLPILSDRCFKCHGPDSAARKAGLRLDRPDAATSELDSGVKAIVPGKPDESALVERIMSKDANEMMPPPDSGKVLSDRERAVLRSWIEQGAKYEKHWAFVAPVRPDVPEVKRHDLVHNPIDNFVLSRLEAEGMGPSPPATKERLIRRVYFDLVGVPPTLPEIDAFLADNSPDAYEKMVGRLFQSPHYGERMAIDWLDGARFADSNGYQNDFARNMSPWRDWVIDAFNQHKRFDQFVVEQIAGDLLPDSTLDQKIATGFNRNHRTVTEAGSIEDEWFVENVVDRVETTGTVMLGLTVGCARCHDHKFDPISQKEFYQLFAFFGNINEKGVYTETRGNVPPVVKAVTPQDEKKLAEFDAKISDLNKQLAEQNASVPSHRQAWLDELSKSRTPSEPVEAVRIPLGQDSGTTAQVAVTNGTIAADATSVTPKSSDDLFGKSLEFEGKQHLDYSGLDFPKADNPFSWAVWVKPTGAGAILSRMDSSRRERGFDLSVFADRKIGMHVIADWPSNAMKVLTIQPLPADRWSHVIATYDGSSKGAGIAMYVNGEKQNVQVEVDKLSGSTATDQPFRIGMRSGNSPLHASVADVSLFQHVLNPQEARGLFQASLRRVAANVKLDSLSDALKTQLDELLLAVSDDPIATKSREIRRALQTTQEDRAKYDAKIPMAMVLEERKEPRATYVLHRGRYDQPDKDQAVQPDVPAVLPPLPVDAPKNRLGLAKWLVSPENPLTARVLVNRLWQHHFGIGLVKSSDNFGVQSEPPSHPELLDWLATELIQSGWDIQHIQRLIVLSNTYQQRAEATPEMYDHDPDNRLLARGPRYRLQAETLRDNALAVSGLLVNKVGGPSVMPYQPAGLWEELAGGAHDDYTQAHGDDLYRRSLYTYRKRTVPHPSMATFDAPSWEICQVKRARTNTPLQALALLNDVTYMEASRKLAERMMTEGGSSPDSQLKYAFRLATSRMPSPSELAMLVKSLQKYSERFHAAPDSAKDFVSHGESARNESLDCSDLAAHTAVASILLNMDESISKD